MIAITAPVPQHPQHWIVRTPRGLKVVDYRPNTRAGVYGPFSTRTTATMMIEEIDQLAVYRRRTIRACSFLAGLVLAMVGASVLLP